MREGRRVLSKRKPDATGTLRKGRKVGYRWGSRVGTGLNSGRDSNAGFPEEVLSWVFSVCYTERCLLTSGETIHRQKQKK